MPKFLTIGYGDQAGYDRTPSDIRKAAHENDARLLAGGAIMGIAGRPVQVRNPQASGVETAEGPYMRTELPVRFCHPRRRIVGRGYRAGVKVSLRYRARGH